MNKLAYFFLLVLLWAACGFNWGFGSGDKCNDAKKLVASLTGLTGESRNKQEERILKICPDGAAGHFIKGLRLERQGEPDAAIEEYRSAMKDDDSLAEAHGNLGLLLQAKGEQNEAGVELSRGLKGLDDPRYHLGLARLLREGKMYALALFHYKEALRAVPDNVSAHLGLAQTYYGLNRLDEADQEFSKVLDLAPANGEALIGLAGVYRKMSRLDDAIAELNKAATLDPRQQHIHKLLAEAYLAKGEPALAENEYQLAGISRDAGDLDDLIHKGDEYLLARNFDGAVEEYQKALRKRPGWPKALEKLGDAYMAAGSDEEAIASYRKVIQSSPSISGVHYSLGVLYERKGELDEAVAEYREALGLDPGNGDTRRRLADIYTLRGK
ncbi:MAG TPA: tetratricopeptide repeat protein [Geobacteraceae bacterium]|nr:tetratricopeptide repeat protein [Geobacteraceae bacterium]